MKLRERNYKRNLKKEIEFNLLKIIFTKVFLSFHIGSTVPAPRRNVNGFGV